MSDTDGVAELEARWHRFTQELDAQGVDAGKFELLSDEESTRIKSVWRSMGYERYGRWLDILIPVEGTRVGRGVLPEGQLPPWVVTSGRDKIVLLTFDCAGPRMTRATYGVAIDHISTLVRADGEGVNVIMPDLNGVLIAEVDEDRPSDDKLSFRAWGEFLRPGYGEPVHGQIYRRPYVPNVPTKRPDMPTRNSE